MKKSSHRLIAILSSVLLTIWVYPTRLIAQENFDINTIIVCKQVEDRAPVEAADQFDQDVGKLYCFTGINNPGPPATITHVWDYNGKEMARVQLSVGTSSNWRTWSIKKIVPEWTGSWTVRVLDPSGAEIGNINFHIGPVAEAPPAVPEIEAKPESPPAVPEEPPAPEAIEEPTPPEPEPEKVTIEPEAPSPVEIEAPPAPPEETVIEPAEAPEEEPIPPQEEAAEPDSSSGK